MEQNVKLDSSLTVCTPVLRSEMDILFENASQVWFL